MEGSDDLRREIEKKEAELVQLRARLAEAEVSEVAVKMSGVSGSGKEDIVAGEKEDWKWPLTGIEYERYGRQMIVPNFGLQGQLKLKHTKVLLVGAGGLGCPAAAYLAGAGVGVLGLVDGDEVEVSNLHRQIAHSTGRVGLSKVESAVRYLKGLNPTIKYNTHHTPLTPQNASSIVSPYDLVLDCTDHPTSRYLISDICVLLSKPLVSASAFQSSGQLITLNSPPGMGPCYRCVFPKPPPADSVVGCGEGGIIGPVVGVMGVLQALEAVKVLVSGEDVKAGEKKGQGMLLFSGMAETPFRSVRMRGKRPDCFACSPTTTFSLTQLQTSMDYIQFCGIRTPTTLLQPSDRITAQRYATHNSKQKHLLLDVREKEHFSLYSLPGAINIPISRFTSHRAEEGVPADWFPGDLEADTPIYVVCRVGNDSQVAVDKLRELGVGEGRVLRDIRGGLGAWREGVDATMPMV